MPHTKHYPRKDAQTVEQVFTEILRKLDNDTSKVTRDAEVLKSHSRLVSYHDQHLPDIVCFPKTAHDIAHIHRVCFKHAFPIIPYGRATSLEGHISPICGGVVIDMTGMKKIVEYNKDDMDITVEAGVTREDLNAYLKPHNFFFPVDPGANCTIGGMVATRASGTTTVKYNAMRENVLRLKVVTPEGHIITTARRAKKSAAGYDLTRLFIGSEGTLCTIVEVTVRVYAIPKVVGVAICNFETIKSAAQSVIQIVQQGIPVSRIELVDEMAVKAVNENNGLTFAEKPTLFFEFQGNSSNAINEQAELVQVVCKINKGFSFKWELDEQKKEQLWRARHKAYYSTLAMRPESKVLTTDICVPISKLADVVDASKKDFNETGVFFTLVSHAGDGNFHLIVCLDTKNPKEKEAVEKAYDKMIFRALEAQGTCTGEHGIGIGKLEFLLHELGSDAVTVMRTIKEAIDPKNIMNPYKLIPTRKQIEQFRAKYELAKQSKL